MIQGRLRDYPITDLLGLISGGQKSGVLTVRLDEREARIHFELGKVLYARVEDGANLGEYLVRFELMNPEEIQSLIARQHSENPHTPLGMMAVRSWQHQRRRPQTCTRSTMPGRNHRSVDLE